MFISRFSIHQKNRTNIRVLTISILIFCFLIGCGSKDKELVDMQFDRETVPLMTGDSITMLISDSGIIRHKVVTPEWQSFDGSDPYDYFPQGIYYEQFDSLLNKQVTLVADTAWNYTRRKLWRLKGNVFISNIQNETFKTEEVFWDEKEQKIYSDKYIEINRPQKLILKGFGFESNQNMTQYRIFRPHDTNIYVEENKQKNIE